MNKAFLVAYAAGTLGYIACEIATMTFARDAKITTLAVIFMLALIILLVATRD